MHAVLISTYELGRQPFGLASPAAWLRKAGCTVTCVDLAVQTLPHGVLESADLIGFYLPMHTATRLAAPVLEKIRSVNPAAHLVAFGLYAPLNEEYLRQLGIRTIIGGEFEAELTRLVSTQHDQTLVPLQRLAFVPPERHGLPELSRYASLVQGNARRHVGYTEASRGCKHACRHCPVVPVYQGTFRVVPVDVVMADVRQQVAAGAQHITFGDPDFFNGPAHAVRIVEALHHEFPQVTYDATIKVEHLLRHRDLLPLLTRTGCLFATTAVESFQDDVLALLEKGHARADFLQALALCREAGLNLAPTFIAFTPWTTLASYREFLQTLAELRLIENVAPVQWTLRLLITANSRLLLLDSIQRVLGPFDPASLVYRWTHPDPALDALAARVFRLVAHEQKSRAPRTAIFEKVWQLAHDAPLPDNYRLLPRTDVPYLNEPWYC